MLGQLQNRVPPPIVLGLVAVVMWGLSQFWGGQGQAWALWLALALIGLAFALMFPALRAFAVAQTTINPVRVTTATALVTGGVYRFSRNPMYLAMALILCAWALWLGSWLVWLGPLVFVLWIDRMQIAPEEQALHVLFPAEFAAYRARVRRWI